MALPVGKDMAAGFEGDGEGEDGVGGRRRGVDGGGRRLRRKRMAAEVGVRVQKDGKL